MIHVLKGSGSRVFYLKGRSPFINHPKNLKYGTFTLQVKLSYMTSGALD
jgi:protein associated with RNAse G/E